MANIPVARRYARALLDAAGPAAEQVLEQLERFTAFFEATPEVLHALSSPALARTQRSAILAGVLKASSDVHPLVANLLRLLVDRSRFTSMPAVTRQFRDLVDARAGRVRGAVVSAVKLDQGQVQAIRKSLESLTERTVVLEEKIDPSLLGGVVAQVGSKVYDGSLRSALDHMARSLSRPTR